MPDRQEPLSAYRGDDGYVFVSYAHADSDVVLSELERLHAADINVWYDEGITPGSRWTEELANAISNSSVFLAFISPEFVASENCLNEIEFALNNQRQVLAVHLRETELPSGLELSLGSRQAILKHELPAAAYEQKLEQALTGLLSGMPLSTLPGRPQPGRGRALFATAIVVALAVVVIFGIAERPEPDAAPLPAAVAVLPFETAGADADSAHLGESLAADLSMRLGSWRAFPVIAQASVTRQDSAADITTMAGALNARYLVQGNIRFDAGVQHASVALIDGESQTTLWSQRFEGPAADVLGLQEQLAGAIVAQISPALLTAESERAARRDPDNLDAWEAAFRGWWHVNRDTREDMGKARSWFEAAIEQDPTWSWPHATTALTHYRDLANGWASEQTVPALTAAAERAMALDPQDSFSHHALGHAYQRAGRTAEAIAAFARGVELTPHDAMANACYGMQLAASNQPQRAIEAARHAMNISPTDPWSHWFALVMARAHYAAGEYPQARQWADRSMQLKPSSGALFHSLAATAMVGEVDAARARVADVRKSRPLPPIAMLQKGFSVTTEADYVARLMQGLRLAGFEE